jgi:hypothetical protein
MIYLLQMGYNGATMLNGVTENGVTGVDLLARRSEAERIS